MPDHRSLSEAFEQHPLFEDKTWKLSPEAWPLASHEVKELRAIGQACYEFYQAIELLYNRSRQDKNLLRNGSQKAPWVAQYLDRGKPRELIDHTNSRQLRSAGPVVIRPDLLLTEKGFALTEMDSIPGGIGLTAFLNTLYGCEDKGCQVLGLERMIDAFYEAVAAVSEKALPLVAILVSDEAATYRPEMDWLAEQLQARGLRVYALHTSEIIPLGDQLCINVDGNPEVVDVIYRFWELFDLANIPEMPYIFNALEQGTVKVTPPMRHIHEEKMNLAFFHHPRLQEFWRENLSKKAFKTLKKIIPKTWIMDPVELPPNAFLDGPQVGGQPIWDWNQLKEASQKERNLILKISGFHETAWGARSIIFGSDASRPEWSDGIDEALEMAPTNPYIVQEYEKPRRMTHPLYAEDNPDDNTVYPMQGRVRLCPYYFVKEAQAELTGVLATFCPADKKIIHGMRDAALVPCKEIVAPQPK